MKPLYTEPGNISQLEKQLADIEINEKAQSLLFLMADQDKYSNEDLIPLFQKVKKPIIGGVFPELIFKGERMKRGVLLIPLEFRLKTQLFDLSLTSGDFIEQLELAQGDSLDPSSVLFVFADALNTNKESFIESLFNFFGINPSYIGGGAGSLRFQSFPCIINNAGLHSNAAVIGWANKKIALGVAHGWHSISNPLKVTKATENRLIGINWKPAFEVYKTVVEAHSGVKFDENNFFEIAKSYPLGIPKIDAEMVVRDPYMEKNNMLYVVDAVKEGEYVEILHGNMESLLEGAANAREIAMLKSDKTNKVKSVFCIDCISRVLFMQDSFQKELEVVGGDAEVSGILTIGEIANSEESFLEIYNKTVVIGIW